MKQNWKETAKEMGIEVFPHLDINGNKIGWFNFSHPKGYLCLAQNGTFSVVESKEDWSAKGIYCTTEFEHFIDDIEKFVPKSREEFKEWVENHIKLSNKRGYGWWNKVKYDINDDSEWYQYIRLVVDHYNELKGTNYEWS